MSNFSLDYLQMLRNQVDDEIDFLISNKHQDSGITDKCPFCYLHQEGTYRCNRLRELKQFQFRIAVELTKEKSKNTNNDFNSSHCELPQLLQPF